MNAPLSCPACGAAIPADAPLHQCPRCLAAAAIKSHSGIDPTQESPAQTRFVPPTVQELQPRFPQYELIELIGQGGMGAVYKARQIGLERLVAIKLLPSSVAGTPGFADRFLREARALGRLNHANIVAVYDFGQAAGLYFFAMEYVDGLNLREAIQAGTIQPPQALAIVPQICEALQFAHDEGIVHRDIKPENILIDKRGRVKIADFGLAKLFGPSADDALTGTQQVMGTLRYMAPEQMDSTKEVDHRADIFSLGVVFYEMLTGELPVGRFPPPSKKVEIDVRLDEVVLRALETEPQQRYQQAIAVKSDVESILSQPAVAADLIMQAPAAATGGTLRRAWQNWWAELDRRFVWLIQNALILLHVVGLIMFLNFSSTSERMYGNKRSITFTIGSPSPWFRWDSYPEPNIPFRGGVNFVSWSMLIAIVAHLVYYVYWQIEITRNPHPPRFSSPKALLYTWLAMALTAAIVGMVTTNSWGGS